MDRDEAIKTIWMPVIVVVLTALLGGILGTCWQNRSFRRNAFFQAKIEMLTSARDQALDIRQDVDVARRQIRANERFANNLMASLASQDKYDELNSARSLYCAPEYQGDYVDILREAGIRVESLREVVPEGEPSVINDAVGVFLVAVRPYIACLDKEGCPECNEHNEEVVLAINQVVAAHTKAMQQLLSNNE